MTTRSVPKGTDSGAARRPLRTAGSSHALTVPGVGLFMITRQTSQPPEPTDPHGDFPGRQVLTPG